LTSDASKNWRAISSKSSKDDCVADTSDATKTVCQLNKSHWYREFNTNEGDADIVISTETPEDVYEVWGWVRAYSTKFTGEPSLEIVGSAESLIEVSPVFPAYVEAKANGFVAEEEVDEEEEEKEEEAGEGVNADDGATSVTTFAAAVIAVVASFSF